MNNDVKRKARASTKESVIMKSSLIASSSKSLCHVSVMKSVWRSASSREVVIFRVNFKTNGGSCHHFDSTLPLPCPNLGPSLLLSYLKKSIWS